MGKRRDKSSKDGKQKIRVSFRPNRLEPGREKGWTRMFREGQLEQVDPVAAERINRKGELSRKRTIVVDDEGLPMVLPLEQQHQGLVLRLRGPVADVDDGKEVWPCSIRRILRTRLIEQRHPLAVGDRVQFSIVSDQEGVEREGVVESVDPRRSQLCRRYEDREHTIAANVDQVVIVSSADAPPLKPHLIDRYLVAASVGNIRPIICINKVDLDEELAAEVADRYRSLDYDVLTTSAVLGAGIEDLARRLKDKVSVFAGQSGTGKSSLLNAIQPDLHLKTGKVSVETLKGRHTTTIAQLLTLSAGGYVVDTPGVRAFEMASMEPGELEAHFPEFAEPMNRCKFPDCAHTNEQEDDCGVKQAVAAGQIYPERYESYLRILDELIDWDTVRSSGGPRPKDR